MMAAVNVFNVAFGFNETELTSLLEDGKYKEAEEVLVANAHTSYLEEGCHQRTPLFIVLCGTDRSGRPSNRNFYIAKMLAQCGASPNFRVPETNMGLFTNPGKSPLELLVEFYIHISSGRDISGSSFSAEWNPRNFPVNSLDNKGLLKDKELLKDEIMELIFILLSHGGDCNIRNRNGQTLLHRVLLSTDDMRILQFLCESGADMNAKDVTNTTPLMCCCSMARPETLKYMIGWDTIQIDDQNRYGQTALFFSMKRGDWKSTLTLVNAGCDTIARGSNYSKHQADVGRPVSPLLVSFISEPVQKNFRNMYFSNNQSPSLQKNFLFSHRLLDNGKFIQSEVVKELHEFVTKYMPNFTHLKRLGTEMIHSIFGNATCPLRQQCARQIFINWVRNCWPNFTQHQFEKKNVTEDIEEGITLLSQTSTLVDDIQLVSISVPIAAENYTTYGNQSHMLNVDNSKAHNSLFSIEEEDEIPTQNGSYSDGSIQTKDLKGNKLENNNNYKSNEEASHLNDLLLSPGKINFIMLLSYIENLQVEDIEDLVLKSLHLPKDMIICFELELLRLVLLSYFGELVTPSDSDRSYSQCDGVEDSEDDGSVTEEDESDLEYW